jgi:hypothetical protein
MFYVTPSVVLGYFVDDICSHGKWGDHQSVADVRSIHELKQQQVTIERTSVRIVKQCKYCFNI